VPARASDILQRFFRRKLLGWPSITFQELQLCLAVLNNHGRVTSPSSFELERPLLHLRSSRPAQPQCTVRSLSADGAGLADPFSSEKTGKGACFRPTLMELFRTTEASQFYLRIAPCTLSDTESDCLRHTSNMKLDVTMQIVFGILSALIAVFGIWLAWRCRGESSCFLRGLYPTIPPSHPTGGRAVLQSLTPHQPEKCRRNAQASLYCPPTTITHRPKAVTSRIRLCNIPLGSPPGTAAHTCLRPHNKLAGCSILSVSDDSMRITQRCNNGTKAQDLSLAVGAEGWTSRLRAYALEGHDGVGRVRHCINNHFLLLADFAINDIESDLMKHIQTTICAH
jgi:hypothetical protein